MAVTETITRARKLKASARAAALSTRDERAAAYVEILDLRVALEQIGREWVDLEHQLEQATAFQGFAWACAVEKWLGLSNAGERDTDHQIVICRNKDGELTGVWPVQVETSFGAQFVVALGEPFNQYSDILVAPDVERNAVIDAMLVALQSLDRFSGVILRKVRDDARCVARVSEFGQMLSVAAAPAVDLERYGSFGEYHKTVKTKTRKNLRNARNRLERDGAKVTHTVHHDPQAVADVARRAHELRAEWLEHEGLSSRAFMDSGFEAFIATLCEHYGSLGSPTLLAFELKLGDEMLSLQWGFVDRGRYYAFMAVRNPAYDAQSPGRLHLEDVLRSCADLNVGIVDFLAPDVDYKQTWATETMTVRDYGIAFTPTGRFILSGLLGAPRRWARGAFDRMPYGLRQSVIRLVARVSN